MQATKLIKLSLPAAPLQRLLYKAGVRRHRAAR